MKKIISIICACACAFAFAITSLTPINAATTQNALSDETVIAPREAGTKYTARTYSQWGAVITVTYALSYDTVTGQLYGVKVYKCTSTLPGIDYSNAILQSVKLTGTYSADIKVRIEYKRAGFVVDYSIFNDTIYS